MLTGEGRTSGTFLLKRRDGKGAGWRQDCSEEDNFFEKKRVENLPDGGELVQMW